MNIKKTNKAVIEPVSAVEELEALRDCEVKTALIEADAGDFAAPLEIRAVLNKWKLVNLKDSA